MNDAEETEILRWEEDLRVQETILPFRDHTESELSRLMGVGGWEWEE